MSVLRDISRSFARLQRRAFVSCDSRSESECLVLLELLGSTNLTIAQLATRLGSDSPWMSRTVERLRKRGLVVRAEDPKNRRRSLVRLTRSGRTSATRLNRELNLQSDRVLSMFTHRERRGVLADLNRLAQFLRTLDEEG